MTKKELRAAMKKRNLSLSPAVRAAASRSIFGKVGELPVFASAQCIALFCALPDEPATGDALEEWSALRRIVIPRVEGEVLRFYPYAAGALCCGAFGIAEPQTVAEPCDPGSIDLIVVPGTAFTTGGARMGRGRGYYDKYLSQPGLRAVKVGVCYAHQVVPELPVEAHDVKMDFVITNQ